MVGIKEKPPAEIHRVKEGNPRDMEKEGGVPGFNLYSMLLSTPGNKIKVESKVQPRTSPCKMRTESEGETKVLRRHSKVGAGRLC